MKCSSAGATRRGTRYACQGVYRDARGDCVLPRETLVVLVGERKNVRNRREVPAGMCSARDLDDGVGRACERWPCSCVFSAGA